MKLELNIQGRDDTKAIQLTGTIKKENSSKLKLPELESLKIK